MTKSSLFIQGSLDKITVFEHLIYQCKYSGGLVVQSKAEYPCILTVFRLFVTTAKTHLQPKSLPL